MQERTGSGASLVTLNYREGRANVRRHHLGAVGVTAVLPFPATLARLPWRPLVLRSPGDGGGMTGKQGIQAPGSKFSGGYQRGSPGSFPGSVPAADALHPSKLQGGDLTSGTWGWPYLERGLYGAGEV